MTLPYATQVSPLRPRFAYISGSQSYATLFLVPPAWESDRFTVIGLRGHDSRHSRVRLLDPSLMLRRGTYLSDTLCAMHSSQAVDTPRIVTNAHVLAVIMLIDVMLRMESLTMSEELETCPALILALCCGPMQLACMSLCLHRLEALWFRIKVKTRVAAAGYDWPSRDMVRLALVRWGHTIKSLPAHRRSLVPSRRSRLQSAGITFATQPISVSATIPVPLRT